MDNFTAKITGLKAIKDIILWLFWNDIVLLRAMPCVVCYHLYNFKNVKNIHEPVLLLVKLQAEACYFTKRDILRWVFFTFLKLQK